MKINKAWNIYFSLRLFSNRLFSSALYVCVCVCVYTHIRTWIHTLTPMPAAECHVCTQVMRKIFLKKKISWRKTSLTIYLLKGYLISFVLLPKACLQEQRHLETSCYFMLSFWTWNKCYQLMTASSCTVKIALAAFTWSCFLFLENGDLPGRPDLEGGVGWGGFITFRACRGRVVVVCGRT